MGSIRQVGWAACTIKSTNGSKKNTDLPKKHFFVIFIFCGRCLAYALAFDTFTHISLLLLAKSRPDIGRMWDIDRRKRSQITNKIKIAKNYFVCGSVFFSMENKLVSLPSCFTTIQWYFWWCMLLNQLFFIGGYSYLWSSSNSRNSLGEYPNRSFFSHTVQHSVKSEANIWSFRNDLLKKCVKTNKAKQKMPHNNAHLARGETPVRISCWTHQQSSVDRQPSLCTFQLQCSCAKEARQREHWRK